jgi:hypothetical protein
MESQQSKVGGGRGRGRRTSQPPDSPSISTGATSATISSITGINSASAFQEPHPEIQCQQSVQSSTENNTVASNLSSSNTDQLKPKIQLHKLHESGTLGQAIQVIVTYFPVLQFPEGGLVYRYYIEIRNKRDFEIARVCRR